MFCKTSLNIKYTILGAIWSIHAFPSCSKKIHHRERSRRHWSWSYSHLRQRVGLRTNGFGLHCRRWNEYEIRGRIRFKEANVKFLTEVNENKMTGWTQRAWFGKIIFNREKHNKRLECFERRLALNTAGRLFCRRAREELLEPCRNATPTAVLKVSVT